MEHQRLVINGILLPPGCRRPTAEEQEEFRLHYRIQGRTDHIRHYMQELILFEPTEEHERFLATLKHDTKLLRMALHQRLKPQGLWAHNSKPSGPAKEWPRVTMLLRPPFLSSYDEQGSIAPYANESVYVLHLDEKHTLDSIRLHRRSEVDRRIARRLYESRDALERHYGDWETVSDTLAGAVLGERDRLAEGLRFGTIQS